MAIALALASAVVYGISDYVGGRASRRVSPLTVTFLAELTLVLIFVPTVPVFEDAESSGRAVVWGLIAGASGSTGVLGLYAALSRGGMTVVAPITGVVAAVLPVIVGIAIGERPAPIAFAGIVLAVAAVALIGGAIGVAHVAVGLRTVATAAIVGALFGMLFIAYSRAGDDTGLWPLVWARFSAAPLLAVGFVGARVRRAVDPVQSAAVRAGLAIGVLICLANGLYLLSTREGLLSIVAVTVSLYPASTIVLATVLDHERASRSQIGGMALAAVAVTLITVGS